MNKKDSRKIPNLYLEKHSLGESTDEEKRLLEGAMTAEKLKSEMDLIQSDNINMLSKLPSHMMASQIKSKLDEKESKFGIRELFQPKFGVPVLVAAVLAVAIFTSLPQQQTVLPDVDILTKGHHSYLNIYRKSGEEYEKLETGEVTRRGDLLQVRYIAAEATHGVIVSIDGTGTTTLHFPEDKRESTRLSPKGETSISHSYELDAAPQFERFFFVTSKSPIDVSKIMQSAETYKDGKLELPVGLEQYLFEIKKVEK